MSLGFDVNTLVAVAKSRGYPTSASVAQVMSRLFGIGIKPAEDRMRYENINFDESFVLASFFEMTPKEYCDTFLHGLFRQTREGHFICAVDDPGMVLRRRTEQNRLRKARAEARKAERDKIAAEVREQYGTIEGDGFVNEEREE